MRDAGSRDPAAPRRLGLVRAGSRALEKPDRCAANRRRDEYRRNVGHRAGRVGGCRCGLQKVARYDAARAIDSLTTERITQDAADQRAGRAGRLGPGRVQRLWDPRARLRAHREPDIHRIDLSSAVLDILGWGGNPHSFEWFEQPRDETIAGALRLLERLEAVRDGQLTATGRAMQSIALHPRLARILIAGSGSRLVSQACSILSERLFLPPRSASTSSDLLSAIDGWNNLPPHIHRVAGEIEEIVRRVMPGPRVDST